MTDRGFGVPYEGNISRWGTKKFLAANSTQFYQGQPVGFETASNANQGLLVPCVAAAADTVVYVGVCTRDVLTTTSTKVEVDCSRDGNPLGLYKWDNASSSVSATSLGSLCYFASDHEVSLTGTSNPLAGRVFGYDSVSDVVYVLPIEGAVTTAAGSIAANQVTAGTAYQVLRTNAGATASEWGRLIETYAAVNATNDVSIQISQGKIREITACGDGKNVTLATTGAIAGDAILIFRPAIGATTGSNIVNGGAGAGTLMAMTANKAAGILVVFDGTNWKSALQYQAA
jgi:hypothetical protein